MEARYGNNNPRTYLNGEFNFYNHHLGGGARGDSSFDLLHRKRAWHDTPKRATATTSSKADGAAGSASGLTQTTSRVVKNDFLLRISIVRLQLRCSRRKNPHRISVDTPPVFSSPPPRFVKTLKMLTTEPFFTTLLVLSRMLLLWSGRANRCWFVWS